jgi:hypothetical protein
MFGGRTSLSFNGWEQQLAASVRMASTLLYLKDADIVTIYQKVSKRMYNMWFKIDGEVAEHPDADLKGAEFANGYLKWEKQFLERMETQWINRPKNEALAAKNKIDSKKDGFAGQKVVSNIDIEIQSGNLDPNKLKFAQGLLAWNTQRP